MHVLQAIRWGLSAWQQGVTATTIANCWLKSQVLGPKYGPITRHMAVKSGWEEAVAQDSLQITQIDSQLQSSITTLVDQDRIHSAMSITAFLNPSDEAVDDHEEEILETVIEAYSEGDRAQETDEEEPVEVIPVKQQEAMDAILLLQRYEEQQDDGNSDILRQLGQLEISVRGRMCRAKRQTQITSYFA